MWVQHMDAVEVSVFRGKRQKRFAAWLLNWRAVMQEGVQQRPMASRGSPLSQRLSIECGRARCPSHDEQFGDLNFKITFFLKKKKASPYLSIWEVEVLMIAESVADVG